MKEKYFKRNCKEKVIGIIFSEISKLNLQKMETAKKSLFGAFLFAALIAAAQPASWSPRGVGGGGAMYSPSISPHNANNVFIACDMSPIHQSTDFGQSWSLLHYLQLPGGRNTDVQFTSNPLKLFTLKKASNFYTPVKSFDGGSTWVNATNPCTSSAFQYYASPYDTNIVVVNDPTKIYFTNSESTGGFSTLLTHPLPYGGHLAGVYFENKDTIYVCAHDSLIYTFNGGASWASASAGTNGIPSTEHIVTFKGAKQGGKWVFYAVTIQANALGKIYMTFSEDYPFFKGIYKLSQSSNQWNSIGGNLPVTTNPPATNDKAYLLGLARNDTSVVYLTGNSFAAGVSLGALWRSTDGGASFANMFLNSAMFNSNANVTTGWIGKHTIANAKFKWNGVNYIGGLSVDPNNSSRLIIGDGMLVHTSTDMGSNWQQAYTDVNFDNAPSVLLQQSSQYITSGLETTSSYWLDWTSPTDIFACYNDIVARRSTDGGNMWSFDIYGLDSSRINDVNMTCVHPVSGLMYAACGEVAGSNGDYSDTRAAWCRGRISVSADNGINWTTLKSFGHTVSSIALDPLSANGMYATVMDVKGGVGDVYHCTDIINTPTQWTRLASPPRTENRAVQILVLNNGDLVSVYGSRDTSTSSSPSYVFSNSSGVFYSSDGGLTWADSNVAGMTKSVVNVEIDKNDLTQSTWLAFVGNKGSAGGVFRTTDKGLNWTQVYNQPVLSGTFHPSLPDEMYICTQVNGLVYATNTNSNSFSITPVSSYPFRNPQKVFFNPYDVNEVWVASFGNGFRVGSTALTGTNSAQLSKNNELFLFPNPANDKLLFAETLNNVEVLNALGQVVLPLVKSANTISVSGLANGIYFIRSEKKSGKFIVKH
ncbi:MAG: T9SS type A sorting domain-containing protein [Bacteroidia bacterium]|nr:T9SS type A sorting domain-containing protein [Bacteroidia bacterium]